jgi:signal transduction histidine kinase
MNQMNNPGLVQKSPAMASLRLEDLANATPAPCFWMDLNHVVLGVNLLALEAFGSSDCSEEFIGQKLDHIYPQAMATELVENQRRAIKTKATVTFQATIKNTKRQHYTITLTPLQDDQGNIVGSYAVCTNVGAEKNHEHSVRQDKQINSTQQQAAKDAAITRIFKRIEGIAEVIPIPFHWLDTNYVCLGLNSVALEAIGFRDCPEKIIGHSVYDVFPREIADEMASNHYQVIKMGKTLRRHEVSRNIITGKLQYYISTHAPLRDDQGNIIGTYGVAINITAEKEAKLRKAAQEARFSQIISQAVHDIRSPLASMMMVVKASSDLPVATRLVLKDAASSIDDIAENLLQNWQSVGDAESIGEEKQAAPTLVSLLAMQVIAAKRFQFQSNSVKFTLAINEQSYFSCIRVNASRFKRTLSNLINNAVAAYEDQTGEVVLTLITKDNQVIISIQDQGKGIKPDVLEKIRQGIQVTSGKKNGQGIGLTQVRDTLALYQGKLAIDSKVGKGTTIQLSFPKDKLAPWLADSITIHEEDTLVVLDDEPSMHQAWRQYFKQSHSYQHFRKHTIHFTQGQEAVDYINASADKDKLVLLTDYELLKQPLNGVDVIKRTGLKRVIVVTSHYDDKQLRDCITDKPIKVLPKQLAWQVPIQLCRQTLKEPNE